MSGMFFFETQCSSKLSVSHGTKQKLSNRRNILSQVDELTSLVIYEDVVGSIVSLSWKSCFFLTTELPLC